MNVGASGIDGHYHLMGTNGTGFSSMINLEVDFVAPGAESIVHTTQTTYDAGGDPWEPGQPNYVYVNFGGTSAAAPHVTGIAALMMSFRNQSSPNWNNIVHEDCEALIKRTCTDLAQTIPYGEWSGIDTKTGYGLVAADLAVASVEPKYNIRHIDKTHFSQSNSMATTLLATTTLNWQGSNNSTVPSGFYNTEKYEVTYTYSYNYSNEILIDSWPLYKASTGFNNNTFQPPFIPNDDDAWSQLNAPASLTSATMKTYAYHLIYDNTNMQPCNIWLPAAPASLNPAFTLYTESTPVKAKDNNEVLQYFHLYPNPTEGKLQMGYFSKTDCSASIEIFDNSGRMVYGEKPYFKSGLNNLTFNLESLEPGLYFFSLSLEDNNKVVRKIVIK